MSCIVIEIEHFRDGSSVPRAVRSLIVPEPGGHSWPQGWNTVVAKDPHQRQGRSKPLPLNGAAIQKGIWRTSNHASHKGGDRAASSRKRNKFPQGRLKDVNPRDSIRRRTGENRGNRTETNKKTAASKGQQNRTNNIDRQNRAETKAQKKNRHNQDRTRAHRMEKPTHRGKEMEQGRYWICVGNDWKIGPCDGQKTLEGGLILIRF